MRGRRTPCSTYVTGCAMGQQSVFRLVGGGGIAPHHLRVIVANASEDPVPGIKAKPSPKVLHLVAVRFAEFQIIEGCDAIPANMQTKETIGQRRIRSVARANGRRRWDPPEFQQAGFPDRIVCGRFFKL